jgi:hypothetical protein
MASLIVIASVIAIFGVVAGAFVTISFAIRRDDWAVVRGFDAPNRAARSARVVTGYTRRM